MSNLTRKQERVLISVKKGFNMNIQWGRNQGKTRVLNRIMEYFSHNGKKVLFLSRKAPEFYKTIKNNVNWVQKEEQFAKEVIFDQKRKSGMTYKFVITMNMFFNPRAMNIHKKIDEDKKIYIKKYDVVIIDDIHLFFKKELLYFNPHCQHVISQVGQNM